MKFAQAQQSTPLNKRLMLHVGVAGNYAIEPEMEYWARAMSPTMLNSYLRYPENLRNEAKATLRILSSFKEQLQTTSGMLSVISLNEHVIQKTLEILQQLGLGPYVIVFFYLGNGTGKLSIGWEENQQWVSQTPFDLVPVAVTQDDIDSIDFRPEIERLLQAQAG